MNVSTSCAAFRAVNRPPGYGLNASPMLTALVATPLPGNFWPGW